MRAEIRVRSFITGAAAEALQGPLELEAGSSPPGGRLEVKSDKGDPPSIVLTMVSEDLSTSRAMLNSYMGLLAAAARSASLGADIK